MCKILWQKIKDLFFHSINIKINKKNSPIIKIKEKIVQKNIGKNAIIIKNK